MSMKETKKLVTMYDMHPKVADLKAEVLSGLKASYKSLPPKLFYDKKGSELFDDITRLPEYYPTRTEISILKSCGDEMVQCMGERCMLIEFGSGSSTKVRLLLDRMQDIAAYMPVDISKVHLYESAEALADAYPGLPVLAVCTDYTQPFELPFYEGAGKEVIFFPGSTIGNFEPEEAELFLARSAAMLRRGDGLLIGVDLRKSPEILEAAYNDSQGVTAAFNLNVLERINRDLGANFDVTAFEHHAFYNESAGRIEMHLRSLRDQDVSVAGEIIHFQKGESIHTENSYKYTVEGFQKMARLSGYIPIQTWIDPLQFFSIHYLEVR
ncbi:L-histidine N(alpha)-methyltransferase [Aneurinibacillus sp. REN35]|uniref:L-histidine N(alpha)-methyltransferase n=1 Tax=Aneurinibacillus sp. REN35 TaxID=3237286 RepID=UPI003527680A